MSQWHTSALLTSIILTGCGLGKVSTETDCKEGFSLADDGQCYPSGLDADADADTDADSDTDTDADTDADTDTDADIEEGDCSASITGSIDGSSVDMTKIAWGATNSVAFGIGVSSGNPCEIAEDPMSYTDETMILILSGWTTGVTGDVPIVEGGPPEGEDGGPPPFDTGAPVEPSDMTAMIEFIPSATGSGEPEIASFTGGTVTLTQNGPTNRGLIGTLNATGDSGDTLSGDISACWCQAIVTMLEDLEDDAPPE